MKINGKNAKNDFILNYQKALQNYNVAINFYKKNIQCNEEIKKIISQYKDGIISFKNKICQIKINLIKAFFDDESKNNNFSIYNDYIQILNKTLNIQIEILSNSINDIEKNIIPQNIININDDYLNILQINKNNLENDTKSMEQLFNEYNNRHKIFIDEFNSVERDIQNYYFYLRKKQIKDTNLNKFNKIVNIATKAHKIFLEKHSNFQDLNKKYFNLYEIKMKEIEKEIIHKKNETEKKIKSFLLNLTNNLKSMLTSINEISTKKNVEQNDNINNNEFNAFKEKYLLKINTNYENEKYKIKSIESNLSIDYLSKENKEVMETLNKEFNLEKFVEFSPLILIEEDVYQIVKFFYSLFTYVDIGKYNFEISKKKLGVKQLTNKLLQPGLVDKKNEEFKELLPINDDEIKVLENYLKKNRDYIYTFLQRINEYRIINKFDMPEREFSIMSNYFILIINCILEEKKEAEDFPIIKLVIILSQTFYVKRNDQKFYLSYNFKGNKLFSEIDFLSKYLKYIIKEELEKSSRISKTKISDNSKKQILFSNIFSFNAFLKELDVNKDDISKINESVYEEYNLDDEYKNSINESLK